MKTVTPETRLSYWQHVEHPRPDLRVAIQNFEKDLYREAKRAETEKTLRELVWYIGAISSAVMFCFLCAAFIVLIWGAMQ